MSRPTAYRAPWWLPGGHLQTIFPLACKPPLPAYQRERWHTPDGDFIELDLGKTIKAHVDGVPVLEAGYGTSGGHYAIRIERVLTNQQVSWIGDQNA